MLPLVHATTGVPYDARAVMGAGAPSTPALARVDAAALDSILFPVPSRHEAVVGVPLETYPPLPVPRLHREPSESR